MLALAIQNIRPNSDWYLEGETYDKLVWLDKKLTKPTEEEINDEIIRIKQLAVDNEYHRLRAKAYPSVAEQLDMLYHGGYDEWKTAIQAVKDKYPKPV